MQIWASLILMALPSASFILSGKAFMCLPPSHQTNALRSSCSECVSKLLSRSSNPHCQGTVSPVSWRKEGLSTIEVANTSLSLSTQGQRPLRNGVRLLSSRSGIWKLRRCGQKPLFSWENKMQARCQEERNSLLSQSWSGLSRALP